MTPPLNCSPRFDRRVRQVPSDCDTHRLSAFHRQITRSETGRRSSSRKGAHRGFGRWPVAGRGIQAVGSVAVPGIVGRGG